MLRSIDRIVDLSSIREHLRPGYSDHRRASGHVRATKAIELCLLEKVSISYDCICRVHTTAEFCDTLGHCLCQAVKVRFAIANGCLPMAYFIDPNDFEPLDADERCDKAYGNCHIGRDDESRYEIALFFNPVWLPNPEFFQREMWSIVYHYDGRVMALSEYASAEHSNERLQELLGANIRPAKCFAVASNVSLSVAVVELAKPAIDAVDSALRAYTAYVGYGNISSPSDFRTIIAARQTFE